MTEPAAARRNRNKVKEAPASHAGDLEVYLAAFNRILEDKIAIGKEQGGIAASESRKGLLALNGAGLAAIIPLSNSGIPHFILAMTAWLFFTGLISGLVAWIWTTRYFNDAFLLKQKLLGISLAPQAMSLAKTAEEIDNIGKEAKKLIDELGAHARGKYKLSRPIGMLLLVSVACFVVGLGILVTSYTWDPTSKPVPPIGRAVNVRARTEAP
jgi:hypothetical protein